MTDPIKETRDALEELNLMSRGGYEDDTILAEWTRDHIKTLDKALAALDQMQKPMDVDALVTEIIDGTSIPPGFTSGSYLKEALHYMQQKGHLQTPVKGWMTCRIVGFDSGDGKNYMTIEVPTDYRIVTNAYVSVIEATPPATERTE